MDMCKGRKEKKRGYMRKENVEDMVEDNELSL